MLQGKESAFREPFFRRRAQAEMANKNERRPIPLKIRGLLLHRF